MKLLVATLLAVVALASGNVLKPKGSFELLILHNNDMHAHFEQSSQRSGTCTNDDREAGKCYGGFPRVAHVVKEARAAALNHTGPPVLYLNAGDTYTGTAWFTIYKWKIAAEFVNALQPDAVSLGNNEVEKDSEVSPFLQNLKTNILASNVVIKSAEGKASIEKSIIFDIEGVKVGVVGYLTPENSMLDSFGNVEYIDEVLAVTEEVEKLQAENVNIIIALGHSATAKHLDIAKEVAGVDMVITGTKNIYYMTGQTVTDFHEPVIITQQSGKQVPVIPSTAYNKYLGSIRAQFDENGELLSYNVDPILLDSSVPQDPAAVQMLNSYASDVVSRNTEVIGNTSVVLDGETCHKEECNYGNLIADAVSYYYAMRYEGDRWTDAPITIIQSGAIAGSIAPANRPADITRADLLPTLPLESNIVKVTMSPSILRRVLEQSVYNYNEPDFKGQLLQFSGVRAVYDLARAPGSRLVSAVVRCWNCYVPEYYEIEDNRSYTVLMPAAVANGDFGFSMLNGLYRNELAYDEVTCLEEYVKLRSPLYPEVAGRIVLQNVGATEPDNDTDDNTDDNTDSDDNTDTDAETDTDADDETDAETGSSSALSSSILLLTVTVLIIAMNYVCQ
ncbi:protein 5NUC isoform X1 [Helicoverpa armigera]|uniref:protein 5NUC isoform X1 n=1 Tax=Helicoverpa armigera TaxID=29058 RepID=UPI00308316E9